MDQVHYLNIEYFLLRVYELFTGVHIDVSSVPGQAAYAAEQTALALMAVAVVLLASVVYIRIKLVAAEHEGFHKRDEKMGYGHGHGHGEEEHEDHQEEHHVAQDVPELSSKNPRWEHVMTLASSPNDSDWRRAIIEADIMLGQLLTEKGYRGSTIGEQLKDANPLQFTTLDLAWKAHKMRNAITHMGEAFPLSERDVRMTIDQYARVFEEFGII
jgi:hypothetical protein